jgi:hypothetical protein
VAEAWGCAEAVPQLPAGGGGVGSVLHALRSAIGGMGFEVSAVWSVSGSGGSVLYFLRGGGESADGGVEDQGRSRRHEERSAEADPT